MKSIGLIIGNITNPSGTERAVANLANILVSSKNYRVVIISFYSENGECYYSLNDNIKIIHGGFSINPIMKRIASYSRYASFINSIIKSESLDAVIATGHQYNSLLVFVSNKVKKIACEHMNYMSAPIYSRIFRKLTYSKLDAIVCLTKKDSEHYTFINKDKLFVIPNSLSFVCDSPAKLESKRIIGVGRLTKQKGWDYLVAAAPQIKAALPDWHIDIFGTGEDKPALIEQMTENGTGDYITLNEPTKNIRNEFLNASIMVETSRWEGLPMVLVEAQACGLPIVGFDCPEGPADIIADGECGYLVKVGDTNEIARKIIELAKSYELRVRMGARGYELANRFSPYTIYESWKELFKNIF